MGIKQTIMGNTASDRGCCMKLKFLVSIDPLGIEGFVSISIKNVLYLEFDKFVNRVLVHTRYNHYFMPGPTKFWVDGLNNSGCFFRFIDRTNAANIQNILRIDKKQKIVFFRGTPKTCAISRRMLNKITNEFPNLK